MQSHSLITWNTILRICVNVKIICYKYKTLHVYEDGTVRIPRPNDDQPEYMKIKGVGVISVALRPTPTRLTKLCPGMPHLPEQANWGQPQDGNQIPIYCFLR